MSVFPLGTEPLARSYGPASQSAAFQALVKQADGDGQYLVEITTYKGGEARSGGLAGLAEIPLASNPPGSGVDVGQVTLRYADRHWVGAPAIYDFDFTVAGSLPAAASLSRASSGYDGSFVAADGFIDDAGAGATRWTYDPASLALAGLLVEPERTNLIVQSNGFTTTWAAINAVPASGAATSPDGTANGWRLVATTAVGAGQVYVQQALSLTDAAYACSVFLKADSLGWAYIRTVAFSNNGATFFNLATGETGSVGHTSAEIVDAGNGWYRCTIEFTPGADADGLVRIGVAAEDGNLNVARDGASSILIWGAQCELGAKASSYIPTTTAALTRAADVLVLSVPADVYVIRITRAAGTEQLLDVTVGSGGYTVPVDVSALRSVAMVGGANGGTTQANTLYEGRVLVPLVMERQMPLLPEDPRRVQRQFGEITIANGDGQLDDVVQSYAVDGRRVVVKFGPYMGAYANFSTVADVVGTFWEANDLSVRLALRDRSYNLDLPLQDDLYAGTGGAEGTAEIEGKPRPLLFGRCRNVTPVLVDPTNLIYQVHDGAISAFDDIFDRAAALTASGSDVADYDALVAASVGAGQYTTALAVGMFRLGSSPDGLITADVRGDATPDYQNTLDTIALRILEDRAGLDGAFINRSTFAGAAAIAGELGIYISQNETPTTAEVLSALLAAVGGWWGAARDGRIRAGRLSAPESRTPNLYLDAYDILALEPQGAPVPRWRQRTSYQRNWTVQRGEDLAASVTDARRQFLTEPVRAVAATDSSVKNRHLQALDPDPLPTLYESSADAQTLADYLLALHGPDRRIFRITVKRLGYLLDLQSIVNLTWPRLGLSGGRNFSVIGIREDADRDETILTVWG